MTAPQQPSTRQWLGLGLACLIGTLFACYLVWHALAVNGRHGFPIDDAWIHLTYARNLIEQSTFAYFPGDPTSSGSTSPLYTLLVALCIAVFGDSNPTVYGLGIACHAGFLALAGLWAQHRLGSPWLAAATVLLLGSSRHLSILAISGMETSLFLLLIALVFYAHATRRSVLLGIGLGLLIWARTDGLVLVAVIAIDAVLRRTWVTASAESTASSTSWWKVVLPIGLLGFGYGLFNRLLGGEWLPSTFAGTTVYYSNRSRFTFLDYDVVNCFVIDAWMVWLPFVLIAIGAVAWRLLRGRAGELTTEAGWAVALPLAYLVMLPFAGRFQRYLVPALPAFAVLGSYGLQICIAALRRHNILTSARAAAIATAVALLVALTPHLQGSWVAPSAFARQCNYHYVRHERVGQWLRDNTPADAVVATHDIGAIAYYSRRRVIDMVGLVRPEVIEHLHTPGYTKFVEDLLLRTEVSFVATLRNWVEVDNARPDFVADPNPEIMEIYRWRPGRTRLIDPKVTEMRSFAAQRLKSGDAATALNVMRQANQVDGNSARSWALTGRVAEQLGQRKLAITAFRKALALNPDNRRTQARLRELGG